MVLFLCVKACGLATIPSPATAMSSSTRTDAAPPPPPTPAPAAPGPPTPAPDGLGPPMLAPGGLVVSPRPAQGGDGVVARPRGAAAAYDPALEERDYSRSLMSPHDLALLKADIEGNGFMTIEGVRELIAANSAKETQEARGEIYAVDPELLMMVDTRTDFRVFIAGDNVYTREELFEHYPFEAFRTTPEDVFVQQEIGVFPPKLYADPVAAATEGEAAYEYVARDLGDEEEFIMIEDLVGRAARKNYKMRRAPVRVAKTKVFLAKEKWDDFVAMGRFAKSYATFVAPLMLAGGDAAPALALLFGGVGGGGAAALQDAAGLALEREREAQGREQAALRALEEKARALQAREDELRRREEALFRSLGVAPPARAPRDFKAEAAGAGSSTPLPADDSVPLW